MRPARVDVTEQIAQKREEIRATVEKDGLDLPEKPEFTLPKLPTNLTDLSDDRLMRLMAKFARFQDYVDGQLKAVEIDEALAESRLEYQRAKYLVRTWEGNSSDKVTIAKAQAAVDPVVQKVADIHQTLRYKRKFMNVMADSLARDAAVLSRELSRRIGRDPVERRVDRYTA